MYAHRPSIRPSLRSLEARSQVNYRDRHGAVADAGLSVLHADGAEHALRLSHRVYHEALPLLAHDGSDSGRQARRALVNSNRHFLADPAPPLWERFSFKPSAILRLVPAPLGCWRGHGATAPVFLFSSTSAASTATVLTSLNASWIVSEYIFASSKESVL